MSIGAIMNGSVMSTIIDRYGLVYTIAMTAPVMSRIFRRAILAVAPATDLMSSVSFVMCDISSPVLFLSKNSALSLVICLNVSYLISATILSPIHIT